MFGLLKIFFRLYNRFFSPDKLFAGRLRSLVGFTPSNLSIFKLAFYHKSASSEKLYAVQSNERLEYLGDAVLGTIVAEYLFKKYPSQDEGFLTKMRSKIVKRQSLNKIADKMGLDVFLSQYNNTRLSRSMLGNALEALVGAVYIECGYRKTKHYVIQKILRGYLDIHELESFDDNYKSQLLEWCQKNGQTVSYKMLAKYKFEKRDRFKVAVLIDGKKLAVADDFNKKSAEQTASEKAMKVLGLLTENKEEDKDDNQKNSRRSRPTQSNRRDNRTSDNRNRRSNDNDRKTPEKSNRPQKRLSSETNNDSKRTSPNKPTAPKEVKDSKPKTTARKENSESTDRRSNKKPEVKKEQSENKKETKNTNRTRNTSSKRDTPKATEEKENIPKTNNRRIQKKSTEEKNTPKEREENEQKSESKSRTERSSRRSNSSRRSGGRSMQNRSNEIANEESIEIEIPVDLTKDIVDKANSGKEIPPTS